MTDAASFLFRFFLFAVLHSLLAIPSLKKRLIGRNRHLVRFYRLYYNITSLLFFGWVMAAFGNSAVLFVVPGVWSLVLYFMQMVFLIILVVCVRQTGTADFLGISGKSRESVKSAKLVSNGFYRVVRHPLYLFSMLFLVSNPIVSVRSLLLTIISSLYFFVGAWLEERRLALEFGKEYLDYQRSVPFIVPRIFM